MRLHMNALMPWIRRTPPGSNAGGVRPRGAVVRAGRGANIVRDQVSRLRLKIFWGAQYAFVPRIKNTILTSSVPERKSQSVGTATDLQVKPRSANWWRVGSKRFASRTSIGILSNHSPESRFRNEATHAKRRYWAVAFGNHPPQKKFAQRGIFRVNIQDTAIHKNSAQYSAGRAKEETAGNPDGNLAWRKFMKRLG